MKRLYFVRHGITESNARNVFAGQTNPQLLEEGKQQARATGLKIKQDKLGIDLIMCSPMDRTIQTANIIAIQINYPANMIQTNTLLLERAYGELEGTSQDEYFKDHTYQDIDSVVGAESIKKLQARATQVLDFVRSCTENNILIVGHGAFGRALRRVVQGLNYDQEYIGPLQVIMNAEIIKLL